MGTTSLGVCGGGAFGCWFPVSFQRVLLNGSFIYTGAADHSGFLLGRKEQAKGPWNGMSIPAHALLASQAPQVSILSSLSLTATPIPRSPRCPLLPSFIGIDGTTPSLFTCLYSCGANFVLLPPIQEIKEESSALS